MEPQTISPENCTTVAGRFRTKPERFLTQHLQCPGQLVGTRCAFALTVDSFEAGDHLARRHPFRQSRHTLRIAMTAARKNDFGHGSVVFDGNPDMARTYADGKIFDCFHIVEKNSGAAKIECDSAISNFSVHRPGDSPHSDRNEPGRRNLFAKIPSPRISRHDLITLSLRHPSSPARFSKQRRPQLYNSRDVRERASMKRSL